MGYSKNYIMYWGFYSDYNTTVFPESPHKLLTFFYLNLYKLYSTFLLYFLLRLKNCTKKPQIALQILTGRFFPSLTAGPRMRLTRFDALK